MTTATRPVAETEDELVGRARRSISDCNWTVGECAAQWTKRFAKGRTDADFAVLVGLSADQVYQRRRVWETFGDVQGQYPGLRWSHFYVALNWDDAPECLQYAEENGATIAEMKAWRTVQRGEELGTAVPEAGWSNDELLTFVPNVPTAVQMPRDDDPPFDADEEGGGRARSSGGSGAGVETLAGVARESDGGSHGGDEESSSRRTAVAEKPRVSAEQLVKKMTVTLERMVAAMNADFVRDFENVPKKVRSQFLQAAQQLTSKIAEL